jgi:hypothetical protein
LKRLFFIIIFISSALYGDITKRELDFWNSKFLSMIISDNPSQEEEIRKVLNSIIRYNKSGYRLLDRFGLFLYETNANNITIQRINFFSDKKKAIFYIIFKESSGESLYCLYLQYEKSGSSLRISDSFLFLSTTDSFSMGNLKKFFGGE